MVPFGQQGASREPLTKDRSEMTHLSNWFGVLAIGQNFLGISDMKQIFKWHFTQSILIIVDCF